jgi:hypothetical protein
LPVSCGELEAQGKIETAQQQAALANYGSIALGAFDPDISRRRTMHQKSGQYLKRLRRWSSNQ